LRVKHALHGDEAQQLLRLAEDENQVEGQPVTGEPGEEAERISPMARPDSADKLGG
jgi:hypothetical protein